jgi:Holliday junction DNA helicase RuvA
MIALIHGQMVGKSPQAVVVDVGGVGYEVQIPLSAFPKLPDLHKPVTFHTVTHVREDALQLFGFLQREERDVFLRLVSVSGIGPRLALNILSGLPLPDLIRAVELEDVARLKALPGVGAKTAGRLILELKGKLSTIPVEGGAAASSDEPILADALSALENLGYPRPVARETLLKISRGTSGTASLEDLIRESLKVLVR